ncbi:transcriptional regulator [Pseudoxanthomonas sacheonensis]|nr:transcriptional regulator [Pseudoxanthomonas sacheonensis]
MKSIYERSYRTLLSVLVQARKDAGLTQQQLADKLGRPQSFVSKTENGERRIDVVEFLELCRLVGADPHNVLRRIEPSGSR